MFCYQCEQTVNGGCTVAGNCGKDKETAILQDLLFYITQGIGVFAYRGSLQNKHDQEVDAFMLEALFTTVTNVDFDASRIEEMIKKAVHYRHKARQLCGGVENDLPLSATFEISQERTMLVKEAEELGINARKASFGEDVAGLQEMIRYGLMGAAAYADHALVLGKTDQAINDEFHRLLAYLAAGPTDLNDLLAKNLETGALNLKVMELLDKANTETYGHPEPTKVSITPKAGKAILVSGHDLKDLQLLLEQTSGKNINIYTHGEMLPANAYPGLKKYDHLKGNYGGAWQDQRKEFDEFPGSILMTTNCIQKPKSSYQNRLFTTGLVGYPGVRHIADKDFTPVIEAALAAPGFAGDSPDKKIIIGFGHQSVLGVAGQVIDAVKSGAIKHFYLIGGCDGAKSGRNYYSDAAQAVPGDAVILTLACGKFRFNKLDFGDIGGMPRLLDIGQCNDAYSAIKIASALAEAFGTDVNGLPLTFILSWYEQKAVAILLTLLHLGIKNMKIGPSLPAFITSSILNILVEKYSLAPISSPDQDLALTGRPV